MPERPTVEMECENCGKREVWELPLEVEPRRCTCSCGAKMLRVAQLARMRLDQGRRMSV